MTAGITVMQVFAAKGICPEPSVSWSVGSQVASMYANEFGEQPPKDNRPKTGGGGTHCFAIYPLSWATRIGQVIDKTCESVRSQQDLFQELA